MVKTGQFIWVANKRKLKVLQRLNVMEAIWRKLLKKSSKLTLGEQYDVVEVSFDNDIYWPMILIISGVV
jgi:hypothetical protein